MKSLQDQIVAWLARDENKGIWFPKGKLTDDMSWQYVEKGQTKTAMSDTVSRKLRLCEEEKRIAVKPYGESVQYRFLPVEKRPLYIPTSERAEGTQDIIFHLDEMEEQPKKRTNVQNNSIHLYLDLLSKELNNAGYDMKKVLKPEVDIPWSTTLAKEYLWKPIQEALLRKKSTTELETSEVSQVYEVLNRHLGEKLGIHVEFPSQENTESYLQSIKD